ncbi:MAG: hypothetical protein ACM31D_12460 [Bacteroidota bacterium]
MAFRVFRGGGGATTGGESGAPDSADAIGPVLDRLDSLAAALEALDGGNGETVKTTLSRMERRDIQTFSAIDTFATALKSVSHHLAHLRQSVHSANTQHGAKLDGLSARLEGIESRLESGLMDGLELDFSPMAAALDMIGQRLSGLEAKLDGMAQQQAHWPFDADAFATALATIADRLARVESKVDSVAQQPSLEPEATASLLTALVDRLGTVENKVDSGADGTSIAACLLAVDRRLSRIESGLGMDRPLPAAKDIPDLADVVAVDDGFAEDFSEDAPPALPEPEAEDHPVATGIPPVTGDSVPAQAPQSADGRDRVDQLLEQVFKVLAR